MSRSISRRTFLNTGLAGTSMFLAGCNSSMDAGIDKLTTGSVTSSAIRPAIGVDSNLTTADLMYAAQADGEHVLPSIPFDRMEPRFRRQRVVNKTGMPAGTILIDPHSHFAHYIFSDDEAVRYGVGVGKAGFEWSGDAVIGRKATWPRWTPPVEMLARSPQLAKYAHGMPGDPKNPLGARALYLYANGRDTPYRLHGTPEWSSIGQNKSSGCIRFLNQDIIDLFNRVPKGTRVRVL